jgi:hypothetical protein
MEREYQDKIKIEPGQIWKIGNHKYRVISQGHDHVWIVEDSRKEGPRIRSSLGFDKGKWKLCEPVDESRGYGPGGEEIKLGQRWISSKNRTWKIIQRNSDGAWVGLHEESGDMCALTLGRPEYPGWSLEKAKGAKPERYPILYAADYVNMVVSDSKEIESDGLGEERRWDYIMMKIGEAMGMPPEATAELFADHYIEHYEKGT